MFKMNKNDMTYRRKSKLCRRKSQDDLSFFHVSSEQVGVLPIKVCRKVCFMNHIPSKVFPEDKSKPFSFIHKSKEQSTHVFFPKNC